MFAQAQQPGKQSSAGTFDSQPLMCLDSMLLKVDYVCMYAYLFNIISVLNARVSATSAALIGFHCSRNRDSH